jgi:hypothetical protein
MYNEPSTSSTKLATARTLWGQSFDGSANVTGALSSVGGLTPSSMYGANIGSTSLVFNCLYDRFITSTTDLYLDCGNSSNKIYFGNSDRNTNLGYLKAGLLNIYGILQGTGCKTNAGNNATLYLRSYTASTDYGSIETLNPDGTSGRPVVL